MSNLVRRGTVEELEAELAELEKEQEVKAAPATVPDVPPVDTNAAPADAEDGNWKKRYGDLRRHTSEKERKLQEQIDELKAKVEKGSEAVPSTTEEIKAWAEKNPIATRIIQTLATEQVSKKTVDIERQYSELALDKKEAAVRKKHPDFDDIVADDAFHDWVEAQPTYVQNKIYDDGSAEDVIWALNTYKQVKNIKPVNEEREAARTVPTRKNTAPNNGSEKSFSESQIEANTAQWYEKNEEAIREAIQSGKFIYDISGAAR